METTVVKIFTPNLGDSAEYELLSESAYNFSDDNSLQMKTKFGEIRVGNQIINNSIVSISKIDKDKLRRQMVEAVSKMNK